MIERIFSCSPVPTPTPPGLSRTAVRADWRFIVSARKTAGCREYVLPQRGHTDFPVTSDLSGSDTLLTTSSPPLPPRGRFRYDMFGGQGKDFTNLEPQEAAEQVLRKIGSVYFQRPRFGMSRYRRISFAQFSKDFPNSAKIKSKGRRSKNIRQRAFSLNESYAGRPTMKSSKKHLSQQWRKAKRPCRSISALTRSHCCCSVR